MNHDEIATILARLSNDFALLAKAFNKAPATTVEPTTIAPEPVTVAPAADISETDLKALINDLLVSGVESAAIKSAISAHAPTLAQLNQLQRNEVFNALEKLA